MAHAVNWPADREVRAGNYLTIRPDHVMTHDDTCRDDVTRELMAQVQAGDVIIGGFNFGTGSSREQAVTALQTADIDSGARTIV